MTLLRQTVRFSMLSNIARSTIQPIRAPIISASKYSSQAGYGDSGSPLAEHPKEQGARPRSDLENPGPEPVAEGRPNSPKTSSSYSSSFRGGSGDAAIGRKSGERMADGNEGKGGSSAHSSSGSSGGPQPKIHHEDAGTPKARADKSVEQHNKELREGRGEVETSENSKDKVEKDFWTGIGGKGGH